MLRKVVYILFFFLTVLIKNIKAQDPYLSQQYTASQFMSPASVGNGIYNQRIKTNLRSQFINGNNLYRTFVGSWDNRFRNRDPEKINSIGVGLQIVSDQLMNGVLQTNYITLNFSNRIYLDDYGKSSISIGLGGTLSQVLIDKTKLNFADQYDYRAFLTGVSAENILASSNKLSGNGGFIYAWHSEDLFFQVSGNAIYNSKASVINAFDNSSSKIKTSYFVNFEQSILTDYSLLLHSSYTERGVNRQIVIGGSVGIPILNDYDNIRRLYIGCFTRVGDALIPTVNLLMDDYNLGFSYDIFSNQLSSANLKPSGFEISFSKSFGRKRSYLYKTLFD
jgi:type IX secretion system PorP/SprF family membrane protein